MRDFTPVYKCLDELETELNIKEKVLSEQHVSDALVTQSSALNGSQAKREGDNEGVDAELIRQIKRVQDIENLTYADVVYYTKNFDEFYAQMLFANYPSDPFFSSPTIGEEQNKLLKRIVRLWENEHGDYDDIEGWYPTDDAKRPLWFDKYRRILTIEKGQIHGPDNEEPIKYDSKQFHSLLRDYFSKLTDEEFIDLVKTRKLPLPLLEEVVSKREHDELKGCIDSQNAQYGFLEHENKSLKENNEQLRDKIRNSNEEPQDESANSKLTTRQCVALATEFKLRSKKNTEDEINAFLACLTGKKPTSFHKWWSDIGSVQEKANAWAKKQKNKMLPSKK